MDKQGFRLPMYPWFGPGLSQVDGIGVSQSVISANLPRRKEQPVPDSRYPGFAAVMSDARLMTDYSPRCEKNVRVGSQFAVRQWMQRNGDEIMRISRDRLSVWTGANEGPQNTEVPPAALISCNTDECTVRDNSSWMNGVGMERVATKVPELFGTWMGPAPAFSGRKNVRLTTRFEGGRNTPRGEDGPVGSNGPIGVGHGW